MQLSSGTDLAGEGSLYIGIILAAILYGMCFETHVLASKLIQV
jgi:hypothetical protein